MSVKNVGVDVVEVKRFRHILRKKRDLFLQTTFSLHERDYCMSHADPATHFAGTFAAKEAVLKASGDRALPSSIEIRRDKDGKPSVWRNGKRSKISRGSEF